MKILLVEDNESILMGLEYLLSKEGWQTVVAADLKEAERAVRTEPVDLILLDVALPDGDGFTFCKRLKEKEDIPVIFLTAREEEQDVVRGLDLGADDYVIKPFRNRELISRIRNVLRRRASRNGEEISLTKLEYRILSAMMAYPGKLFTREEILSGVWDISNNFVNDNTLTVTVKRLREKLGDEEGRILKTVRGMGYRMEK